LKIVVAMTICVNNAFFSFFYFQITMTHKMALSVFCLSSINMKHKSASWWNNVYHTLLW